MIVIATIIGSVIAWQTRDWGFAVGFALGGMLVAKTGYRSAVRKNGFDMMRAGRSRFFTGRF